MTISPESIYPIFQEHPVISTDSRKVPSGCLFFALKGDNFNGNLFARQALEQGAAFAVIDEPQANDSTHPQGDTQLIDDPRYILVNNVLEFLQQLARYHRRQLSIPVIAITGTNGKTTTKELVNAVLSAKFRTTATQGNLNNHIGVPLTLLSVTAATEIAIIEMGANHPGEIDLLCRIAEPGFGLITNIGKAHLEGFGGYEGVIRTKTELYRYIHANKGTLFINKDNPLLMEHAAGTSQVTYGAAAGQATYDAGTRQATYGVPPANLAMTTMQATPCVEMEIVPHDQPAYSIKSKLYGGYNAPNILAAVTIGHYFGISSPAIAAAIGSYEPSNNRSQIMKTATNVLILDAYNANPSSMEAAVTTFAAAGYEDKTVILGDMLELGDETDTEHTRLMELVAEQKFTRVYLVGPAFTRLNTRRENTCFGDSELASLWFTHNKLQGSTILIKGSRGIRLEIIVETL